MSAAVITTACRRCGKPAADGLTRCAACDKRCRANTERARNVRAAELAARYVATPERGAPARCPKGMGAGICGGPLETRVERGGRTVVACPWCERQTRGICRDCPRPVAGAVRKSLRCAEHTKIAKRAQIEAWGDRNREELAERARVRHANSPEQRARRNEYKRAWRMANPDQVKKQKRREALRQLPRTAKYQARYREKHREHYRVEALRRYREQHPEPQSQPCTKCGVLVPYEPPGKPYTICDGCCWPFQLRTREAKRARIRAAQAELEQLREGAALTKPKKVRTPKRPARTNAAGERLCVGPYPVDGAVDQRCSSVVHGRQKKCADCKAVDRARAAAKLALTTGRGRRTDLGAERVA